MVSGYDVSWIWDGSPVQLKKNEIFFFSHFSFVFFNFFLLLFSIRHYGKIFLFSCGIRRKSFFFFLSRF